MNWIQGLAIAYAAFCGVCAQDVAAVSDVWNKCPHCGRMIETYFTAPDEPHLFGHRIGVVGVGSERGPWCPGSGALVEVKRA